MVTFIIGIFFFVPRKLAMNYNYCSKPNIHMLMFSETVGIFVHLFITAGTGFLEQMVRD